MRILYVSQYFPPEPGAPAARVSELSHHWAEAGHDVTVLTGFPNHPTGKLFTEYRGRFRRGTVRERHGKVDVVRTWLLPLPNARPHERVFNYTSFCISAALRGLFLSRPQVVIATTPQLLVGIAGWLIARAKRASFVLEVRDIWPDAILASGVGSENGIMAKALSAISRFLYKRADLIVVVTPAFERELKEKWSVPASRITVVQNGVETSLFEGISPSPATAESFTVAYVGTVGLAHGIRTILDAAESMKVPYPEVRFVIVGEGAERKALEKEAFEAGITNVTFAESLPRSEIPRILSESDVCLVLLKRAEIFKTVIPTKMLEFMAAGRPVVLGVEGQAKELLEAAGAGLTIEPEDAAGLEEALLRLKNDPSLRRQLGASGRRYVTEHLTREATARSYASVLAALIDDHGKRV